MIDFNAAEVAQKVMEAVKKEFKDLSKLNVMILGKTGAGKSTLINNMFSEKLADTGVGKPVTQQIRKIEKPDFPLSIYDTPGLELSGDNVVQNLINDVISEIKNGVISGDISRAIHCVWYCVSTPSHRIEEAEIQFLKDLNKSTELYHIPIIVVLTQSYSKSDAKELKQVIEKENLPIVNIVPVLAEDFIINEDYTVRAYGLDMLSQIMINVIPEAVKKTFIAVQCADIELKKNKAQAIVASAAAGAAATGAVPIPFSDAALLVPEQITMLASITAVFGLPVEKGTLIALISSTIGTAGTTVLGKTIVSNLLKLIPGVGSMAGGVISGAIAAALTAALGEAYIIILSKVCRGEMTLDSLKSSEGQKTITQIFRQQLKLKRNQTGTAEEEK